MINKTKGLALDFFNKIYGAGNKKLLVWSAIFLLMPFVGGFIAVWISDHVQPINALVLDAIVRLNNTGVFSFEVMTFISKIAYDFALLIGWIIEKASFLVLSPFLLGDALVPICSLLAAVLGAMVLIKTKGQNLAALFTTSMSLILTYAFIFVG
ncbi:MAG: hypothetical protein YFSK_1590 [Candidatus Yanofskyibacterium parasiticum]|nr:MAG: hypothetical protein YFSK_1590 [Candidatus Yanofskybacteria bacterium]